MPQKPKRPYIPPKNYKPVTIYLTPEQHEKVKQRAADESIRLSAETKRTVRISMADYVRSLIDAAVQGDEQLS